MKYIVFDCDGTLINSNDKSRPLYPGVRELIENLYSAKVYKLYVWTGRDRLSTLRILRENNVLEFFEEISTIDDAPAKPNPEGLASMLQGFPKQAICMIGDTPMDILGAKSFGVTSIAVLWNGLSNSEQLLSFSPDFLVMDPKECSKVITDYLKGDCDV